MHINAAGMEPSLKKDFGKDIVFWGGGVDTQKILVQGTVSNVADDVRKNIDALAPGGGFVFLLCIIYSQRSRRRILWPCVKQ